MGIISTISAIISGAGNIVDEVVTNKEEKARVRNQLEKLVNNHEQTLEKELSKRHANDMKSDSWLSKNIRPCALIISFTIYTILAFTDGNLGEFSVDGAYKNMIQQMLMMVFGFYFGGRTAEKITTILKDKHNEK